MSSGPFSRNRLYCGNLPWRTTEQDLRNFFKGFSVISVKLINDRETGRPRGFGFVDITEKAEVAIAALDGQELDGRRIRVSEASVPSTRSPAPHREPSPSSPPPSRPGYDRELEREDDDFGWK